VGLTTVRGRVILVVGTVIFAVGVISAPFGAGVAFVAPATVVGLQAMLAAYLVETTSDEADVLAGRLRNDESGHPNE
jgi:hypothetical protein